MKKLYIFALMSIVFEYILSKMGFIQFIDEPQDIEVSVNDNTFKISAADFAKAVELKKLQIKDESTIIFKKDDYELRTKNQDAAKYEEGKKAQAGMTAKEIRDYAAEKYQIEVDAHEDKDYKKLLEKITKKIAADAKIPESQKLTEYEKTVAQLRENLTKSEEKALLAEKRVLEVETGFKQKEHQLEVNNTLNLTVPETAISDTMTRRNFIAIWRSEGFDAKMIEGKIVAVDYNKKADGEIVKNPVTLEALPLKEVLAKFADEKKMTAKSEGRGAGDATGGTAGTWEAFVKEMADKGVKTGSEAFQKEQNMRIKNKTLKM
jgi:hypothetical protein